jgi:hypothetical protein
MSANPPSYSDAPAFSVVNCVAADDAADLAIVLEQDGYHILYLNGLAVVDKPSLLAQAKLDLPAVPDLEPHNWDALSDYLWNGLFDLPHDRIALVWKDAHVLAHSDLQTLLEAVRVITDLARQVVQAAGGFPHSLTLLLFLVGYGPEYRPLSAMIE